MEYKFWSEEIKRMTVEIFKDLVRINTSNPPGNETEAVKYIQKVLKQHDIESDCFESKPNRGNLIARLKGGEGKPIVLLSHIDVVDADHKKWNYPPFEAVEENGVIWGRGTLDTKQLTTMQLVSMILIKKNLKKMNRDVILIASSDEECGSVYGMEYLYNNFEFLNKECMVISEGGGFPIKISNEKFILLASGEKGSCKITIRSKGNYGHASCPPDNQAIDKIAKAIEKLSKYEFPMKATSISDKFLQVTGISYEDVMTDENLKSMIYYMTHSSIFLNNIDVGERVNVIPGRAFAEIELRIIPGTTEEELKNLLNYLLDSIDVDFTIESFNKGYESDINSELVRTIEKKVAKLTPDVKVVPMLALGRTDGRFLSGNSSMIYGFSPVLEDACFWDVLKKVHGNNECLSVESLMYGTKIMYETLHDLCC